MSQQTDILEQRVVASLLQELFSQDFRVTVSYGDQLSEAVKTRDINRALSEMWACDDEILLVYQPCDDLVHRRFGWLRLIYGEDGWDVIQDHSTNLTPYIPDTLALVDELAP